MDYHQLRDRFRGLLVGTAVGDALGLPAEGLKPEAIQMLGWSSWRHRLLAGRGMVSDDTEHTSFVAQSMVKHPGNPAAFIRSLAWKLRWWLLWFPAGLGLASAKAILRLWLGFSPQRSGVFSAGNGPAMRSAVIGAFFHDQPERMREYVKASTLMTHTDSKAFTGAMAVSLAAAHACIPGDVSEDDLKNIILEVKGLAPSDTRWEKIMQIFLDSLDQGASVAEFVDRLGLTGGVTGFCYHTVPVALYGWVRHHGDFARTLTEVLNCGGDTDTVGAIAGALAGASVGETAIPTRWVKGIMDWPISVGYLRRLATSLVQRKLHGELNKARYSWWCTPLRNIIFLLVVLGHGFLRLVPLPLRRWCWSSKEQ